MGKWSKLVRSVGHVAIGTNEISSGEFRVFCGKMVICVFGCCHGSLLVMKNVVGQNLYNLYYRLGCFFQVQWYEICA